jgi:ABC-type protease/lipase transport system fused ATPase/permease subunit
VSREPEARRYTPISQRGKKTRIVVDLAIIGCGAVIAISGHNAVNDIIIGAIMGAAGLVFLVIDLNRKTRP